MAKEWAIKFYNSTAWKECRWAYIVSVNGLCERCERAGYIVHHKILLTPSNIDDPMITLNHLHLEYVCKTCHDDEHGVGSKGKIIKEGLIFTATGDIVQKITPPG